MSALSTVISQVQPLALPVAVLGELAIAPEPSVNAQLGAVVTSLLEVNVIVMTSASLASPVPEVDTEGVLSVG